MLPESVAKQIIADHQRRPRHTGALPGVAGVTRENASCGDQVTVWADVQEGQLVAVTFSGRGCAISQASASLMTVALRGRSLAQARALAAQYRAMVMGEAPPDPALGDLQALAGVSRLHARRRCALLAWQALEEGLTGHPSEGQLSAQESSGPP